MTANGTALTGADSGSPPARSHEQGRRRTTAAPEDRIVRQVQAIDAWIAARRAREQALRAPSMTRAERMDAAREVEVLRRTHDVIKGCCARGLAAEVGPVPAPGPTVVIAHSHPWFIDKLGLLLAERDMTVVGCTDNGAEAVGLIVGEQPDVVLVGDRLAMVTGAVVLAQARRFAPESLRTAQASDQGHAHALRDLADTVFLRHHPPSLVVDALAALRAPLPAETGWA